MKKRGDPRRFSLSGRAWTALSISLTVWALAIYFYRREWVYPPNRRFRPGKSGTNRERREWTNERDGKTGPIPEGEKAGMARPGGISVGTTGREYDKRREDGRRKGFNKFLRSPLSGVNHTVIGHLRDVRLPACGFVRGNVLLFRVIYESLWLLNHRDPSKNLIEPKEIKIYRILSRIKSVHENKVRYSRQDIFSYFLTKIYSSCLLRI